MRVLHGQSSGMPELPPRGTRMLVHITTRPTGMVKFIEEFSGAAVKKETGFRGLPAL